MVSAELTSTWESVRGAWSIKATLAALATRHSHLPLATGMCRLLPLSLVFFIVPAAMAADRLTGKAFVTRSEVMARNGMAATSHPLATQIALDILKQGGSAVDAAIAANAALALMEPMSCGIGGDLFAIVWDRHSGKLHGLNASGRSPQLLTVDEFEKKQLTDIPLSGPLPVSVPGCVDGWFELHERFGRLPMERLLEPTIRYAREGFPVSPVIAFDWQQTARRVADQPGFREIFQPDGRVPQAGQVFRNAAFANTLEQIARHGRQAFYQGQIAREIDRYLRQIGGYLRVEDLAAHRSEWVDPVSTDYRGMTVWQLPPNGQGIAVLQILNILERFDLASHGFGSPEHLHLFIEAKKLAFEDRARYYADPHFFAELPIQQLISKEYAAERRKLIDLQRAAASYPPGDPKLEHGDTIYLTVADRDRNMVSLIQSNYHGFGSGVCPPGLGFPLQNRGQSFDLTPGRPNSYAPGKRPFHTIIPAFITKNGQPYISFGVMGGAMQPQGHAQIVINLVDFGMSLQEAGDAPRIHHTRSSEPTGQQMENGGRVLLESEFAPESVRELLVRGHQVQHALDGFGGYQAILYDAENDIYIGASESRKDGQAAGY